MSAAGVLAVNWLVDTILFREYDNNRMRTRTVVYEDLVQNPINNQNIRHFASSPDFAPKILFITNPHANPNIFDAGRSDFPLRITRCGKSRIQTTGR